MNLVQTLRPAILVTALGILVLTTAGQKGACVQTFDDGKTFTCAELSNSVCGQGKGDK